ncbi:ABC transporter permease [[Clostridium] hylemonae]|uniref:ABC transporter permease n=1 Tax=[Clostridium] hylemonae TaxID=89153 RepID=UPI00018A1D35|nr:ABC transporter permease [[Clostridium] hylemonae]QEK17194.1 Ribose import permease protein RbsC [[Clostridium] hylemonae DSM 15053]
MGKEEAEKKKKFRMKREYNMLLVLVVMLVVCAFISPTFRTVQNLINLLGHNAVYGLLAVGMAFVIITGGVDLSVGSVCALSGVMSAYAFIDYGFIVGLAAGLAVGIVCGFINGILQTVIGMNHFVATLGMMTIARGAVYIITSGFNIYGIPEAYGVVGMGYLGPVPVAGIIWLACVVIAFLVLKYTRFGQYVYAIGGNMNAAWLSGINTKLVKTVVYVICGFFAGLAGVVLSCRTLLAAANAADTYELTAISACIVGGLSLDGGRGNVWGSVVGVLILGLILNIMQLTSVSSYWQDAVKGIIIIGAVAVDCMSKLKRD